MKKLFFCIITSLLLAAPSLAQQKSAAKFDNYEWDFGRIEACDGAVCHYFTMRNISKAPVTFGTVIPSCGCIQAICPDEVVAPGGEAKVLVVFNPTSQQGKVNRSVELLDKNGKTLAALSVTADVSHAVVAEAGHRYPYLDTRLSNEERVENLISLLTPEEKVGLMMNKSISIDRLGIPSYNWWSEACHGVRQGGYTVYPQPIGMAASFDAKLFYDVFSTVSDEARANWNRSDHNVFNVPMGAIYYPGNPELTFWCPNVNIFR
ncbi:MAG: DUF1573 domain-containing protein, partial [Prevotella sp.]|nr:DUF1573 domain-containing protein [Prevotella sp.]